jgi:hypothetical protein
MISNPTKFMKKSINMSYIKKEINYENIFDNVFSYGHPISQKSF